MGWQNKFIACCIFDESSIDAASPGDHGKPAPSHRVLAMRQCEFVLFPFYRADSTAAHKVDFDRYLVANDFLRITFQCRQSIH